VVLEMERGTSASKRRLEPQVLHFDGLDWSAYSYRWNDAQTDAELVPTGGAETELNIVDAEVPGGRRKQTWRFHSRTQCLICHNGWAGPPLGFTPEQLRHGEQLDTLRKLNVVAPATKGKPSPDEKIRIVYPMADPYDGGQPLATRARSYLHANCSHCHQGGAGGTALI